MPKSYVSFETPVAVQAKALEAVETAKNSGLVRKGTNEVTKAIERGDAKLVLVASDVEPEEIVMHLPVLCLEKRVPIAFVAEKLALGKAAGLGVPTAAIAIVKAGGAETLIKEVVAGLPESARGVEEKKVFVAKEPVKKTRAVKKAKETGGEVKAKEEHAGVAVGKAKEEVKVKEVVAEVVA